eukprot:11110193-Ditylum_brightwellii.AAC.1
MNEACDHDFSYANGIPSVTLLGNIPSDYDGSFFSGGPEETDRGPDHNITFLCVQLAPIATQVFLYLQNVALTRGKMSPWAEEKVSTISSMQRVHDIHKKLEEEEHIKRISKARAEEEKAEKKKIEVKLQTFFLNL